MGATRRGVLAGVGAALATGTAHADQFATDEIFATLVRYTSLGVKHAGGSGDTACGAWLHAALLGAGFAVTRQSFDAPFFTAESCALTIGEMRIPLLAQAPVHTTAGLTAPLVVRQRGVASNARGAIVVVPLSYRRWSTSLTPEVTAAVETAAQDGAVAVLLVTTGPTGEVVALNVEAAKVWPLPVAIVAPKDLDQIVAAAQRGASATLDLKGTAGRRSAFNVVATLDRGKGKRVVVSTPRSGWTVCAGERGGGVAAWLAIAKWAARALPHNDLTFVCTSAHEYEYFGGEHFLKSDLAPKPAETHLWAHLGANFAARDWHEFGGRLAPLPSVDPQRVLMGAPDLLPTLRESFRGAPGLESPYPTNEGAAGELASVLHAGYARAFGIFGAHRFHHVAGDDARCVDARHVAATALMLKDAIARLAR